MQTQVEVEGLYNFQEFSHSSLVYMRLYKRREKNGSHCFDEVFVRKHRKVRRPTLSTHLHLNTPIDQ